MTTETDTEYVSPESSRQAGPAPTDSRSEVLSLVVQVQPAVIDDDGLVFTNWAVMVIGPQSASWQS
jgi:hypothetical protein